MRKGPGYWWECWNHRRRPVRRVFDKITDHKAAPSFILHELLDSGWDQSLLVRRCPVCEQQTLRVTYLFPRDPIVKVQVLNITGVVPQPEVLGQLYLPMCWATYPKADRETIWYDFKYLRIQAGKRGGLRFQQGGTAGLESPAVMTREVLGTLLGKMAEFRGLPSLP
jgi:hypothetical protein